MALFFSDKKSPANRIKKGDFDDREELQGLFKQLYEEGNVKINDIGWMLTDHRRDVRAMGSKFILSARLQGTFQFVFRQAVQEKGAPQRVLLAMLPKIGDKAGLPLLVQQLEGKHRATAALAINSFLFIGDTPCGLRHLFTVARRCNP